MAQWDERLLHTRRQLIRKFGAAAGVFVTVPLLARESFPWDELVESARVRRCSTVMRRCLEYLRDGLDVAVPEHVIRKLAKQERLGERIALWVRNAGGRMEFVQFFVEWMQHGLMHPTKLVLLPRFLRSYCRVTSTAALLRLVTSRLALNTRRG